MGWKQGCRKAIGVFLILVGIGIFVANEVMMRLYLSPPVETDVASIVAHEVPRGSTVIVRGTLGPSDWTLVEREEGTGKIVGFGYVYSLSDTREGEAVSIKVASERRLEEGQDVLIEGELHYRDFGLPGYVVTVEEEPPIPVRWLVAMIGGVIALLGLVLLVR